VLAHFNPTNLVYCVLGI